MNLYFKLNSIHTSSLKRILCVTIFSVLTSTTGSAETVNQSELRTFFPAHGLGTFLVKQLDLATFRNSLNSGRAPSKRTFASLGMVPTKVAENSIEFDSEDWLFKLNIIRRADINLDNLEDVEICFIDKAKKGTYYTQNAYLITRYSSSSYAIALNFEVDGCPTIAQ